MELEKMKELTTEELQDQVVGWKKEKFLMRVEASQQKKMDKSHKFQAIKKNIARAYTLIRQKQA